MKTGESCCGSRMFCACGKRKRESSGSGGREGGGGEQCRCGESLDCVMGPMHCSLHNCFINPMMPPEGKTRRLRNFLVLQEREGKAGSAMAGSSPALANFGVLDRPRLDTPKPERSFPQLTPCSLYIHTCTGREPVGWLTLEAKSPPVFSWPRRQDPS